MKKSTRLAAIGLATISAVALSAAASQWLIFDGITKGIEEKTGYKVEMSRPKLSLWPFLQFRGEEIRVIDSRDSSRGPLLTADQISFSLAFDSLWTGKLHLSELNIARPVVRLIQDETAPRLGYDSASRNDIFSKVVIDTASIKDGAFLYKNAQTNTQARIESIQLRGTTKSHGGIEITADARSGTQTFRLSAQAETARNLFNGGTTNADATLNAPGLFKTSVSLRTQMRIDGQMVKLNDLTAASAGGRVYGSASFDWSGARPFFAASISFNRLDATGFDPCFAPASTGVKKRDMQDLAVCTMDLAPLKFFDVALQFSAGEFQIDKFHMTAVRVKSTLNEGVLSVALQNGDLYGGTAQGKLQIDSRGEEPTHNLQFNLAGVDALPLLVDAAAYNKLGGRLQMRLDLKSKGTELRKIGSELDGTANLVLQKGFLSGIDVPDVVRPIIAHLPSAWQNLTEKVEIGALSSRFQISNGQAVTEDLHFTNSIIDVAGKGTVDLVDRTLNLRFDPKMMTGAAPSQEQTALDLGVSVIMQGPWASPQIAPDLGMLMKNPAGMIGNVVDGLTKKPQAETEPSETVIHTATRISGDRRAATKPAPQFINALRTR
jgi:AsmA protein